jgi:hypothetical protein
MSWVESEVIFIGLGQSRVVMSSILGSQPMTVQSSVLIRRSTFLDDFFGDAASSWRAVHGYAMAQDGETYDVTVILVG